MSESMTGQQLEQCKQKLLQMRAELAARQAASSEVGDTGTVVLDQQSVGRLSRIDAMQSQQMALESQRRRELVAKQVEAALKRIEEDDYGYCLECDEEIDPRRLLFNPVVTCCIDCADK
ncbi:TraR/DksA family transcriptional regulator [Lacimicrobium alkaliphilum]|nr:TraR/DksA family transcriptional regulator [Lacimicrobium alkaliphilum]